jgi:hypothetical protein
MLVAIVAAMLIGGPVGPPPVITEDSPGWDCRVHGNQICGPTNDQGVPAGVYGQGVK